MERARCGYEAYVRSTGGFDGRYMPGWDDLPDRIKEAWREAISAAATLDYAVAYEPDWVKYPKLAAALANRPPEYGQELRALLVDARADAVQYVRDVRADELARARESGRGER
jgi:hypothetical protein